MRWRKRLRRLCRDLRLLDRVWPDVVVVTNVVYQAIAQLRKALGDEARAPRYIECVPRRGYRIIVDVIPDGAGGAEFDGAPNRTVRSNLPAELTSFVGREHELTEVNELLGQHRLVTIIGFGGCGKSRLALAVAEAQSVEFSRRSVARRARTANGPDAG